MKCIIRKSYSIRYLARNWSNKDGIIDLPDDLVKRKIQAFEPQEFVDKRINETKAVTDEMVTNRAIDESSTKRRMR